MKKLLFLVLLICAFKAHAQAPTGCVVNAQTGTTYTLLGSDYGKCITMNNASANTLTIPLNASVAFPVGTVIRIQQIGAGLTTISPTGGVTLNYGPSAGTTPLITAGQWGEVTIRQTATDVWVVDSNVGQSPALFQIRLPYAGTTATDANIVSNLAGAGSFGIEMAVGPGTTTPTGASACRPLRSVGNFYRNVFDILQNGDMQWCTGVANSVWQAQYMDQTANNVDRLTMQNGSTFASGDGPGIGMSTNTSANCVARTGVSLNPTISGACSFIDGDQDGNAGYPLVVVYSPDLTHTTAEGFFGSNSVKLGVGNTTQVWAIQATSTGTSQASVTIGDTNASSTLLLTGPAGGISFGNLSTGTNADFLCLSAGGVVLIQASACTISSQRFKHDVMVFTGDALRELDALQVNSFKLRSPGNRDPNAELPQIGLIAENVAAIEPKCTIWEDDLKTPKSYRPECITALLVKASQEFHVRSQRQFALIYGLFVIAALLGWHAAHLHGRMSRLNS